MHKAEKILSPQTNDHEIFNSRSYRRSRKSYTLECMFEYFIFILVSGQFLTVLLKHLGVPDSLNGIIQSIISLAFLFQFFSIFILHRINNTKITVILFHSIGQLFFVALFCIPFFPFASEVKHILAMICPLAAYFGIYFVTSIIYRWGNSYVHPTRRGRFGATKEMISLLTGIAVTLAMGYAMDEFERRGNTEAGFILLALSILVFCICDFICIMLIKNDKKSSKERTVRQHLPFGDIMRNTMGNKYFRSTVNVAVLWRAAHFFTLGFMGTYMDNSYELNFSVGTVQVISLIGMFARFALSRPIGKYSDKRSYAKGLTLGFLLEAAAFLVNVFTAPGGFTRYLVIPYFILYNAALAGIESNLLNLPYNYVEEKYFIHASAIKNSIAGLAGFLSSLAAGALLGHIQENGNRFLGISLHGQQVLSFISFILMLITILYNVLVVEKQKRMQQ